MDLDTQIAVIGMAVRLPGARTPAEYWHNLAEGVETVVRLPVPDGAGHQPAAGVLDDPDCFDAEFFGYAPREALIIDPQHRVFLECSWESLEHAGYDPARCPGAIGVYAGCSQTEYGAVLRSRRDSPLLRDIGGYEMRLGSGLDFLTTRAAYKLGLRGPAVTVQTACSTSLVAIHLAGQALLAGECDMALAGGATVHVPPYAGEYSENGILSPDGRCRAFDAAAAGTVGADGVGVVVLKRLVDALDDGDTVHAVVLGSAINNDGTDKIGFTAPSVTGQAHAVSAALRVAGVDPDTVGYVETHGTGTPLGDPVEIAALARAFRAVRAAPASAAAPRCWIGSVKTNLGHTDAAAGVAGFIKTVLALSHRQLPPSLHFEQPNPAIDFAATPFEVNTRLREWTGEGPLRAGVNSLGLGGTNAHVVLQEPPATAPSRPTRTWRLVPLSGRTRRAAAGQAAALADRLTDEPAADLGAVAWTLQTGRRHHAPPGLRDRRGHGGPGLLAAGAVRGHRAGGRRRAAAAGVRLPGPGRPVRRHDRAVVPAGAELAGLRGRMRPAVRSVARRGPARGAPRRAGRRLGGAAPPAHDDGSGVRVHGRVRAGPALAALGCGAGRGGRPQPRRVRGRVRRGRLRPARRGGPGRRAGTAAGGPAARRDDRGVAARGRPA